MALYLGSSENLKVYINGIPYSLNFYSSIPMTSSIRLLSSERFILKDANGLYLIPKEDE